ncbi:MAG: PD40 domain-containing protein [Bradymonadaceae bacterium]|nr:PD40 domain-containing protein [Lujinxingiaceae bacterium]
MVSTQTVRLSLLIAALLFTGVPASADAQIFVYPRRPNQSNVRYFEFEWRHIDILVGNDADKSDAERIEHEGVPAPSGTDRSFELGAGDAYWSYSQRAGGVPYRAERTVSAPTPGASNQAASANSEPETTTVSEDGDVLETQPPPGAGGEPLSPPLIEAQAESSLLDSRAGGVRLYFYERERDIAERAAAFIADSYRYLVDEFRHVPSKTLPYVLYNSYQEFLQTNIFPIQEGVLGVTSRRDLQLILPYFGDHRLFQHVSTHEMVHQFTIQKVRDVATAANIAGDPLDMVPLWFIEGIAEYYAHRGLDPETEMMARDLLLNPDPMRGYVMLDFFEDRPYSGLWTYKIGQVRAAFLEEFYGAGTLQRVLEESARLLPNRRDRRAAISFRALLSHITGDDARTLSAKFEAWLKRRSYSSFLLSEQDSPDVIFLNDIQGVMQTMATSPDGHLIMYRSIQPETGEVRLYVVDVRDPARHRRITGDGRPGVESLHPVAGRTFDVRDDRITFVARTGGRDVIYVQGLRHSAERVEPEDGGERAPWKVDLSLGSRRAYAIGKAGLLAAENPSFSPDGRQIAFIGLDEDGQKDLYIFEALEGEEFLLSRVTNDEYAERGVSWGPQGIVYSSDATGHGRYNLFRYDPTSAGDPERLTFEPRDHFDARAMADGRVLFSAFDAGRANIHEVAPNGLIRRTDIVTGLFDLGPGPNGSVWALFHHRGQRQPVRIPQQRLLSVEIAVEPFDLAPMPLPTRTLAEAEAYRPFAIKNWEISNIFGILGASGSGVFGQIMLLTNDRLRNHAVFFNAQAFGSWESTVANLLYLNQERRLIWGAGLFQDVRYRYDQTPDGLDNFLSAERFYGTRATLRYPLDRFLYVQADLAVGAVSYFLPQGSENFLRRQEQEPTREPLVSVWEQENDGTRFQTSPSLSLGYNTIRYHPGTGPISGTSILLENTINVQPFEPETHGNARIDAEQYFPIYGRVNFSLRGGIGTTYGGDLARQFYLSSFDTLRGVEFGDADFLLGHRFFFSKAELRFPLNFLVRLPIVDLEGILGADFGAAGDALDHLWQRRALGLVTGFNFGLGPLVFRLHFAKPLDIGTVVPNEGNWITNFSLGWRYW